MNLTDILILIGFIVFSVLILNRFFELNWDIVNSFVLTATLLVLVVYTYETKRIADQTVENSIRPVMLRSGVIFNWEVQSIEDLVSLKKTDEIKMIEFSNYKNIVKDISGYIVLNGKKHKLLFTNDLLRKIDENNLTHISVLPKWGWLSENSKLYATYKKSDFEETDEPNNIYLRYQDIQGNKYFTKEDKNYSQSSGAEHSSNL